MAKPARITASRNVSQPVLAVPSSLVVSDLLESVVDGDRKSGVRLLGEAVHRLGHAVEEKRLGFPCRRGDTANGDQFFSLWYGER